MSKSSELVAEYNRIARLLKGDEIEVATCCGAPAFYSVSTRGFRDLTLCFNCVPWRSSVIEIDDLNEIDQSPALSDAKSYTELVQAVEEIKALLFAHEHEESLSELTIAELRDIAYSNGLDDSGDKADLIDRIVGDS
jgi:hypothetical protein